MIENRFVKCSITKYKMLNVRMQNFVHKKSFSVIVYLKKFAPNIQSGLMPSVISSQEDFMAKNWTVSVWFLGGYL